MEVGCEPGNSRKLKQVMKAVNRMDKQLESLEEEEDRLMALVMLWRKHNVKGKKQ
ncbi:hypothetical protein [Endozoicomonas sp.]|uniref:hypothetical protein n=1 Tax=Endozoicomonas sp. TaxID=1892382 RepID=UPI003839D8C8